MNKNRNNNFDLLKIICTFSIIVLHYLNGNFGGALTYVEKMSLNFWAAHLFECLSINAVNLFILVTGYFLIDKNKINISKCFNMILDLLFYSIFIYSILCVLNIEKLDVESLKILLSSIFEFWYIYIYIILYILSPYINKMLDNITKKEYFYLILILIFFFSLWPSFINNITVKDNGYGIINFIVLYIVGGYIKKYDFADYGKKNIIIFLVITILNCFVSCISSRAYNYNFILNIISSITIFNFFKNIRLKSELFYNLQKHSLAVYIIHLNPFLIPIIFHNILKCSDYYNSNYFIVHMIISCILIYVVCICINTIKVKLFDNIIKKILNKYKILNFEIEV